jgi:hypothetical protein
MWLVRTAVHVLSVLKKDKSEDRFYFYKTAILDKIFAEFSVSVFANITLTEHFTHCRAQLAS